MSDRVVDQRWWVEHEKWLRLASHATAAITAANSPTTPIGCRKELLERWARMHMLAEQHREAARALEPQ